MLLLSGVILMSCAGTTTPMYTEPVRPGTVSKAHESLRTLPEPTEKIVAAVYRFRDQTGQYKPADQIASWSTAVTQGATSILIKSMEDSGWFTPIERESISNLLNERQIIQNIRQQHSGPEGPQALPPLLFAGVVLEGGIIGYDTNVITGGFGARYLGTGGAAQYRKDEVTVYLRAVSTQSGRILKTVHTTKSIISQKLDSGVFRFIDANRLLEAEAGYTYNEPPVMAVTEAIDEALKMLILEGIEDGVWSARNPQEVVEFRERFDYEKALEEQMQRDYFGFIAHRNLRQGFYLSTNLGINSHIGNYANPDFNSGLTVQAEYFLLPSLSLSAGLERTRISAGSAYSAPVNSADLKLNYFVTPQYPLSPFLSAGIGSFSKRTLLYRHSWDTISDGMFPFIGFEGGFDYKIDHRFGVRIGAGYRYLLKDGLDGVSLGQYNDQHWGINVGFVFKPVWSSTN
ncbi:MAG: curli production assembly/transport component CsgG [Balneolia bacterium]|nr:curli production assembly/transport component CsgG [Balneolia bacterium]